MTQTKAPEPKAPEPKAPEPAKLSAAEIQERLDAEAEAEPRPDDLIEVKITGACTLGPNGLEPMGAIRTIRRDKAPKSATQQIRVVKRGKKPE
jgi:hypothetical protein